MPIQRRGRRLPLSTSHSNRSLRTESPLRGNEIFRADKEAETALEIQGRRRRDKISLGNPADLGLIAGYALAESALDTAAGGLNKTVAFSGEPPPNRVVIIQFEIG